MIAVRQLFSVSLSSASQAGGAVPRTRSNFSTRHGSTCSRTAVDGYSVSCYYEMRMRTACGIAGGWWRTIVEMVGAATDCNTVMESSACF